LLDEQDRSRWNRALIEEGRRLLASASVYQHPGPYQLQAAIAALHARASRPEYTLWTEIDSLYQALESLQPSPVVTLNRAVATWKLHGPEAALAMIDPLRRELDAYFYLHGLRGALLKELNRLDDAREALNRAIALANSVAEAKLIRRELDLVTRMSDMKTPVPPQPTPTPPTQPGGQPKPDSTPGGGRIPN
jgi:RNA polymerase sigma-70 factor (ECF subfamily)